MMMLAILACASLTGVAAFADSFAVLVILRFMTGIAIGGGWSTGIALVAESWPDRARPKVPWFHARRPSASPYSAMPPQRTAKPR